MKFLLLYGLLLTSSIVLAQEKLPDLMPIVIDAAEGIVDIKNIGNARAQPSRVFIVCSRIPPKAKRAIPCARGLHLNGFIAKWNALPFDIPALNPAGVYHLHVFSDHAFPRKTGVHGMSITVDPLRQIAESNETNNQAHLDTVIQPLKHAPTSPTTKPTGHLNFDVANTHNDPLSHVYWSINHSGQRYPDIASGSGASAVSISVAPGVYDLHLWRELIVMKKSAFKPDRILGRNIEKVIPGITIVAGKTITRKVTFDTINAGDLLIQTSADGKPDQAYISVYDQRDHPVLNIYPAKFSAQTRLKLIPGRYHLKVRPVGKTGVQGDGYTGKTEAIEIKAGKTLVKAFNFTRPKKGSLTITAFVNGSRSKAEITIRKAGTKNHFGALAASYNLFSNQAILLPGRYDLSIRPLQFCFSPGGVDVFHGGVQAPGIRQRRIKGVKPVILQNIEVKPGKTLKQTVKFSVDPHNFQKICL